MSIFISDLGLKFSFLIMPYVRFLFFAIQLVSLFTHVDFSHGETVEGRGREGWVGSHGLFFLHPMEEVREKYGTL